MTNTHSDAKSFEFEKNIYSVDFSRDGNLRGEYQFLAGGHFTRDDPYQASGHLLVFQGT
jgi:hypothetical protein